MNEFHALAMRAEASAIALIVEAQKSGFPWPYYRPAYLEYVKAANAAKRNGDMIEKRKAEISLRAVFR